MIVIDSHGKMGITISIDGGGGIGAAVGLTAVQFPKMKSIEDLKWDPKKPSLDVGLSIGPVAFDYLIAGGYSGGNITPISTGKGLGFKGTMSLYSWFIPLN